jgi:type IV pilus assembly protein PilX
MNKHPTAPFSLTAAQKTEQGGFSLITTLILLAVVMALGIGASQMVLLAERSARFDRDLQIAFQAAEAALLDAEFDIRGPNSSANQREALFSGRLTDIVSFSEGCSATSTTRGLCLPAATGIKSVWYSVDFTDETSAAKTAKFGEFTGRTLSTGTTGIRSEIPPRYIVEIIPDATPGTSSSGSPKALYRVTSMGFGPRKETQAVLQMIFRKE